MITIDAYLQQHGAGHEAELTDQMRANAEALCAHVNAMLEEFGETRALRSGWRPQSVNDGTPNAAHASKHITCQAMDIADDDDALKTWALSRMPDGHYPVLERYGLYAEDGRATESWLHVQIVPPGSGKRVYYPNATWAARAAAERPA